MHMMAKENKMLLSTIWWQYPYLLACVIPIDRYGVPVVVAHFRCVSFTRDSLNLFHYKKGEIVKLPTWVQVRPHHPV
jgi:hypothetical protein